MVHCLVKSHRQGAYAGPTYCVNFHVGDPVSVSAMMVGGMVGGVGEGESRHAIGGVARDRCYTGGCRTGPEEAGGAFLMELLDWIP